MIHINIAIMLCLRQIKFTLLNYSQLCLFQILSILMFALIETWQIVFL